MQLQSIKMKYIPVKEETETSIMWPYFTPYKDNLLWWRNNK